MERQQWEYLRIMTNSRRAQQDADDFGSEGWELVTVQESTEEGDQTNWIVLWFKRPIEEEAHE